MAIKCEINKGMTSIEVSGTTVTIVSNIVEIINRVYNSMKEENTDKAEEFRHLLSDSEEIMFMTPAELHEAAVKKATEVFGDMLGDVP